MEYRINPKTGDRISALSYGCMRFTKNGLAVDQKKTERELTLAFEKGVNYFDTAYIYPGIEDALGKWLAKGYRDKVLVATKAPHYLFRDLKAFDDCLAEQLRRLRTDYIDYYLIHMLGDVQQWERLQELGIEDWIARQKAAGTIRHIGFSYHGGTENFMKVLDAYDWEFCYLQYNYFDETSQAGVRGVRYATEKGVGVIVMEPLRGGRLSSRLPKAALEEFDRMPVRRTPTDWALRWLWNQGEVISVLSGMNEERQILENVATAESAALKALTEEELALYDRVCRAIRKATKIGCTGCGYCMPCPRGVDIPVCFRAYNDRCSEGWYIGIREYLMCTTLKKMPSNAALCVGCGKCEQHCPQNLDIRKGLKEVQKHMEGPVYAVASRVSKLVMRY